MAAHVADDFWEAAGTGKLAHALARELDCWFPLLALSSEQHGGVVSGDGKPAPAGATLESVASAASGRYAKRAAKVQGGHRGRKARREMTMQHAAGVLLQLVVRARAACRAVEARRRERDAATAAASAAAAVPAEEDVETIGTEDEIEEVDDEELSASFDLEASHGEESAAGRGDGDEGATPAPATDAAESARGAARIQAAHRGRSARREFAEKRTAARDAAAREHAATAVQAVQRGLSLIHI